VHLSLDPRIGGRLSRGVSQGQATDVRESWDRPVPLPEWLGSGKRRRMRQGDHRHPFAGIGLRARLAPRMAPGPGGLAEGSADARIKNARRPCRGTRQRGVTAATCQAASAETSLKKGSGRICVSPSFHFQRTICLPSMTH